MIVLPRLALATHFAPAPDERAVQRGERPRRGSPAADRQLRIGGERRSRGRHADAGELLARQARQRAQGGQRDRDVASERARRYGERERRPIAGGRAHDAAGRPDGSSRARPESGRARKRPRTVRARKRTPARPARIGRFPALTAGTTIRSVRGRRSSRPGPRPSPASDFRRHRAARRWFRRRRWPAPPAGAPAPVPRAAQRRSPADIRVAFADTTDGAILSQAERYKGTYFRIRAGGGCDARRVDGAGVQPGARRHQGGLRRDAARRVYVQLRLFNLSQTVSPTRQI